MPYREYSLFMYSFNSTWPKILKISKREPMVRNFPGKDSTGKSGTIQPKIHEIWGNSNGTVRVIPGKKFPNISVYPQGRPLSGKSEKSCSSLNGKCTMLENQDATQTSWTILCFAFTHKVLDEYRTCLQVYELQTWLALYDLGPNFRVVESGQSLVQFSFQSLFLVLSFPWSVLELCCVNCHYRRQKVTVFIALHKQWWKRILSVLTELVISILLTDFHTVLMRVVRI